jgi:phosphatidylinositol 4-kinase type 2
MDRSAATKLSRGIGKVGYSGLYDEKYRYLLTRVNLILDRGLDNWMIKICWLNHDHEDHLNGVDPDTTHHNGKNGHSPTFNHVKDQPLPSPALVDIRISDATASRTASPAPGTPTPAPHIHIGAIDNSLAFPWKHPDEWRSFPL